VTRLCGSGSSWDYRQAGERTSTAMCTTYISRTVTGPDAMNAG
jgi:hypothetical protein